MWRGGAKDWVPSHKADSMAAHRNVRMGAGAALVGSQAADDLSGCRQARHGSPRYTALNWQLSAEICSWQFVAITCQAVAW
jgi:hypothetical protein